MYWIVPMIAPAIVNGDIGLASLIVRAADKRGGLDPETPRLGLVAFAKPKSINFAPPVSA